MFMCTVEVMEHAGRKHLEQDTALKEKDWDQSKVISAGRAEGSFMGKGGRQGREGGRESRGRSW